MNTSLITESYGARLAQSVEHETLNLRVVGSSPTLGAEFFCWNQIFKAGFPTANYINNLESNYIFSLLGPRT